jgi:hypothetical protein
MHMKYQTAIATMLAATYLSGCATLFKGNKGDVYFKGAPAGMEVIADGKKLDLERKQDLEEGSKFGNVASDEANGTITTYYTYGVSLEGLQPRQLTLRLPDGKEATVDLTTGIMWHWVVLNLFTTGGLGLIVDGVTGDWKEFYGPDGTRRTVIVPDAFQASKKAAQPTGPAVSSK